MRHLRRTAMFMVLYAVLVPCALRFDQAWSLPGKYETRQLHRQPTKAKYVFGSSHRPASVVVRSSSKKDSEDESAEAGFTRGGLGVLLLMSFEYVALANKGLSTTVGRAHCESMGMLAVTGAALWVMRSASSRGRLDGGTFRMLSMGSVCAFTGLFYHAAATTLPYLTKFFAAKSVDMYPLLLGGAVLWTCFSIVSTSYANLRQHGLPNFNLEILSDSDKDRITCSFLAAAYAVCALYQVIHGAYDILYSGWKTQGFLQCFIVGACFYVCQTAAVVGPKRLGSATYRTLNVAFIFHSILRLLSQYHVVHRHHWYHRHHLPLTGASSIIVPSLALLTSVVGWLLGTFSKSK